MRILGLLAFCLLLVTACKNETPSSAPSQQNDPLSIPVNGEFAHGDTKATYTYTSSTDKTSVRLQVDRTEKYTIPGIVKKYFFADVNADGKDEMFVVSHEKTGEDKLSAWHIASGQPMEIYIRPVEAQKKGSTEYSAQNGQIVARHTYTDTKGTATTNNLRYNLVAGESGYSLKPQGWTPAQLQRMSGQYAAADKNNKGYYKIMMINETEHGEWSVDLYAKDNKTKAVQCEYHGIAEWFDKDLIMPISSDGNPDGGQISIRIVGLNASVYTRRTADISKLIDHCGGKLSLAANYKKTDISQ